MKTSRVSLICPSCNTNYEIFLKKQPHLIIINCPKCKSSVSCYQGQAIAISADLMQRIQHANTDSSILSIFEDICKQNDSSKIECITKDDIADLQIDLYNCESFEDVMKVVCKKS